MRARACTRLLAVALTLAALSVACGGDDGASTPVALAVAPRAAPSTAPDVAALAGGAITAFGEDLFTAIVDEAGATDNVVVSPASVAIALAMLEPGATGDAQRAMRALLRIDDPVAFHAAMNAFEQQLESRVVPPSEPGGDPPELTAHIANAAYLQQGYPFAPLYLETIGTNYGAVLNAVDYTDDPDGVAHQINDFVSGETEGRITELVPDGALQRTTLLALVNALYLKAGWVSEFDAAATKDGPFTLRSGEKVTVPLMRGDGDRSLRGDGWVGARKVFHGSIEAQFVLPDEARFDEVSASAASAFRELAGTSNPGGSLVVPRFETRVSVELRDALRALGLESLYQPGNLMGIAADERLVLDKALHQTYLALDEEGIEAAAATALIVVGVSAPIGEPVPVVLDRPFLFRVVDTRSGAVLFQGRIMDPTA